MKFNKLFLYIILPFILGGCHDWLSVSPESNINEEDLFAKEDGYQVALNGIYKSMAEASMYGQEMSYGALEILAHTYSNGYFSGAYSDIYSSRFTTVNSKNLFEKMWSATYNAIANCNNLIENVKNEPVTQFEEGEIGKNLILGEAYALRGFLHFDMLRLFAPSKKVDDGKTYIPYYDRYKSTFEPHLTVDQTLEKIKNDLLTAKDLVATFDTLPEHKKRFSIGHRIEGSLIPPDNLFYAYRGYRMNYYAIVATLARVYSWAGDLKEAHDAALEVINAKGGGEYFFTLQNGSVFPENHKLNKELIFVLSNQKLIENYKVYLPGSTADRTSTFYIYLNQMEWYSWNPPTEDTRYLTFLGTYSSNKYPLKYTSQTGKSYGEDAIPMIRVSEMYYIASEYLYKNNQSEEAFKMIDQVRNVRGILSDPIKNYITNEASFEKELIKEIHKDLMVEGQAFYWYKKFNQTLSRGTIFVIPTPDNENIN